MPNAIRHGEKDAALFCLSPPPATAVAALPRDGAAILLRHVTLLGNNAIAAGPDDTTYTDGRAENRFTFLRRRRARTACWSCVRSAGDLVYGAGVVLAGSRAAAAAVRMRQRDVIVPINTSVTRAGMQSIRTVCMTSGSNNTELISTIRTRPIVNRSPSYRLYLVTESRPLKVSR